MNKKHKRDEVEAKINARAAKDKEPIQIKFSAKYKSTQE
jgi:hypothetical protein